MEKAADYQEGRRRRGAVICVLQYQLGYPVIVVEIQKTMVRSHITRACDEAPVPILFHGKFRDVGWINTDVGRICLGSNAAARHCR